MIAGIIHWAEAGMTLAAITKRMVDSAGPGFVWDTQLKGFGLKVTASGVKAYIVQYRSGGRGTPTKRVTIGRHGSPWTPDQARREARRILGEVAAGRDPAAERQFGKRRPSLERLSELFITEHVEVKRRQRTAAEYRRLLDRLILPELGRKRVDDIARGEVARLHHQLRGTPYEANRVLAVLSKLFNWAAARGYLPDGANPCRHIEKYRERARERFLSAQELARLGEALADAEASGKVTPYSVAALRLLVFTGARLNEVLAARWDQVDLERSTLTIEEGKRGRRIIHLNPPALDVLRALPRAAGNPHVIVGARRGSHLVNLQKPWRAIRARAGLEDVRLHDLRHSFASVAAAGGMSLPLIGAMLGHTQPQTTARYAHFAADPLQAASSAVARQIAAAMAGGTGTVVPIRHKRG